MVTSLLVKKPVSKTRKLVIKVFGGHMVVTKMDFEIIAMPYFGMVFRMSDTSQNYTVLSNSFLLVSSFSI